MTTPSAPANQNALGELVSRADCLLFDLDDTLFDQMTYLEGAFAAAAATCGVECAARLAETMVRVTRELGSSCGRIFDEAMRREKLEYSAAARQEMVLAFRAYQPAGLSCFPGTRDALEELVQRWPMGLVTDGPVETQIAKVKALDIERYFRVIVYSDAIGGRATRKPSPIPYRTALNQLGIAPERAVYIGDNPGKDFIGARALGIATIRVRTGEYKNLRAAEGYEADIVADDLAGVLASFRGRFANAADESSE